MMILKEFSRIVCVSLFSYQGSLFAVLRQLVYFITFIIACQVLFSSFFEVFWCLCVALKRLVYSITCSFLCQQLFLFFSKLFNDFCDSLLIRNSFNLSHSFLNVKYFFEVFYFFKIQNFKRRRRDLNPRAGHPTYTLSRGTSSASWVFPQQSAKRIFISLLALG